MFQCAFLLFLLSYRVWGELEFDVDHVFRIETNEDGPFPVGIAQIIPDAKDRYCY